MVATAATNQIVTYHIKYIGMRNNAIYSEDEDSDDEYLTQNSEQSSCYTDLYSIIDNTTLSYSNSDDTYFNEDSNYISAGDYDDTYTNSVVDLTCSNISTPWHDQVSDSFDYEKSDNDTTSEFSIGYSQYSDDFYPIQSINYRNTGLVLHSGRRNNTITHMPHPRTHSISINTTSHVVAPQRSVLHAVHIVDSDKIDYTTTHTGMPHPRAHFA